MEARGRFSTTWLGENDLDQDQAGESNYVTMNNDVIKRASSAGREEARRNFEMAWRSAPDCRPAGSSTLARDARGFPINLPRRRALVAATLPKIWTRPLRPLPSSGSARACTGAAAPNSRLGSVSSAAQV